MSSSTAPPDGRTATWSEPLTALDAMFLDIERDHAAHMHVGLVAVFEGKLPAYGELLAFVESRLHRVPRYRQRLRFVPLGQGRPVWVDEEQFDIQYHVRQTALPSPGGEEQLKALAARLFSQRLDRDKPLWEMWFVDGVPDGRFALVVKTHHCMIDGISGVDIVTVLMDPDPCAEFPAAEPWTPRAQPSATELLSGGIAHQLTHGLQMAREFFEAGSEARRAVLEIGAGLPKLVGLARMGQAPSSSLNQPIGPHRRFEMVQLDLDAVKRVRRTLGGTVNDVVLAVVAGALRGLLESRGEPLPAALRAMIPVSVRAPEQHGRLGNQVTAVFCNLPIGEPDPVRRLALVTEETRGLKESRQAIGALALTRLGEFASPTFMAQATRLQAMTRLFNLVVTNVPGPQHPLFLLGRRMVASFPCVPLVKLSTVGIALLSYDGAIGVGLLGDSDRARDLPLLASAIPKALEELVRAGPPSPV